MEEGKVYYFLDAKGVNGVEMPSKWDDGLSLWQPCRLGDKAPAPISVLFWLLQSLNYPQQSSDLEKMLSDAVVVASTSTCGREQFPALFRAAAANVLSEDFDVFPDFVVSNSK